MRSEQAVFDDLASLCASPGYIHAVAAICFRDNMIAWTDKLTTEDTAHQFSASRLIRTEIATLTGLMMRRHIDLTFPEADILSAFVQRTEALLHELHHVLIRPLKDVITSPLGKKPPVDTLVRGDVLREPIFYSAESAYQFQYRDLVPRKYRSDAAWLLEHKNIDLEIARDICIGIAALISDHVSEIVHNCKALPPAQWPLLRAFTFSCDSLARRIGQPVSKVRPIIEAFSMPEGERNVTFTTLHAFNGAYACPLIRTGSDDFVMLHPYGMAEALYETPFYWMCEDEDYAPEALRHRGEFTEQFAAKRLRRVFGVGRVFENVEIVKSKGVTRGEIDVLVVFGDHAIVLQAKSKKLTQLARKGDEQALRNDFRKAVQESVDQGFACSELLGDPGVSLRCVDGRTVSLSQAPTAVFPISVVADHYPALAFQSRELLTHRSHDRIHRPLVVDVFALDAITEMLDSPLRFVSYLTLRSRFADKLMASHENTVLSHHLTRNLWVKEDVDMIYLDDSIAADLDIAMMVRRDGVDGESTPDGILTRFVGTPFADFIDQIGNQEHPVAIDLGLTLLELAEDAVQKLNEFAERVVELTIGDGELHNVSMAMERPSFGLTIHCSHLDDDTAVRRLTGHCGVRKYRQQADRWYGIALSPGGTIRHVIKLGDPWTFDAEMESIVKEFLKSGRSGKRSGAKTGRNQPCPCGSGKKYKRCCIARSRPGAG